MINTSLIYFSFYETNEFLGSNFVPIFFKINCIGKISEISDLQITKGSLQVYFIRLLFEGEMNILDREIIDREFISSVYEHYLDFSDVYFDFQKN